MSRLLRKLVQQGPGVYRLSYRAFNGWIWRHIPDWTVIDGFQVAAYPLVGAREAERVIDNVRAALYAWRDLDPSGFMRARRVMWRILIKSTALSYYSSAGEMCILDLATAMSGSKWQIAAVLIHEATHAYINRRWVPYTPELKDRIERICVAQELAFVDRIPIDRCVGKQDWIESLRDYIRNGPPVDLIDRQKRHEEQRPMLEKLQ